VVLHGFFQPLGDWADLHQHTRFLSGWIIGNDRQVGAQGFSLFGNKGLQGRRNRGTFEQMAFSKAENVFEDITYPHRMNSRRGTQAVLVIQPFLIRQAQLRQAITVKRFQSLWEGAHQHRKAQKRAGNFNQRKPFVVVSGDGHGLSLRCRWFVVCSCVNKDNGLFVFQFKFF